LSKLGIALAVTLAVTVTVATVVDRNHGRDDSETPPTATDSGIQSPTPSGTWPGSAR
jgi:hypothetical protein